MKVISRITGFRCRFGGKEHAGWLPANAAKPLPTPAEHLVIDIEISEDAGGYLLCWCSRDGRHHGDLWFERIEEAKHQAVISFGAQEQLWQPVKT